MSTTTRRRPRARLRAAAGLGLAVVLLSGCAGLQPGVAIVIGDDEISVDEVDSLAASVCELEEANPTQDPAQPSEVVGSQVRNSAMQALALRSMADQLAEENGGLEAGEDYRSQVEQVRLQYGGVDDELVDAAIPAYTSGAYFVSILRQVGRAQLGDDATDDEALAAGIAEAQAWEAREGVETNPAFDSFSIGDTAIESERSDLAVAVGDTAKSAADGSPEYVGSLPESQRCG